MEETISATEANRSFSRLLSEVKNGKRFVITNHGKEIAQLIPVDHAEIARRAEWNRLVAELNAQAAKDAGKVSRDENHEQ